MASLEEVVNLSATGMHCVLHNQIVISYRNEAEFVHFLRVHNQYYPSDSANTQNVDGNFICIMPIEYFVKQHPKNNWALRVYVRNSYVTLVTPHNSRAKYIDMLCEIPFFSGKLTKEESTSVMTKYSVFEDVIPTLHEIGWYITG